MKPLNTPQVQQTGVMSSPLSPLLYSLTDAHLARELFVNQPVSSLQTPAAIIDASVAKRNCERMLSAAKSLGVGFRPHVKTHKTEELTRLQLGPDAKGGKVVASTIREIEELGKLVDEGVISDILYGIPLPPSSIIRLSALRRKHLTLTLSLLIDHPEQLRALLIQSSENTAPWNIYIKLDMGTHRAGVPVGTSCLTKILSAVLEAEKTGKVLLKGFYCHAGHSYSVSDVYGALELLQNEINAAVNAADFSEITKNSERKLTLSVGATPTARAADALSQARLEGKAEEGLSRILENQQYEIELHAGVYTLLDLQQLSTHVQAESSISDVGLNILSEVVSIYPNRGKNGTVEALISAGSIALGREPGRDWEGWGVVLNESGHESGWIVGRISQEHGILTRDEKISSEATMEVRVGQKVRIVPQHACIAGVSYGWYYIVDSEKDRIEGVKEGEEKVRDVWARWRGW
ncbi:hypothetical protein RUND412_001579 [Rhizina undulata]